MGNTTTKASTKPLKVFHVPQTSLYTISRDGGGNIPHALEGMFTDRHLAQREINIYELKTA